jgi:hypothetical protein
MFFETFKKIKHQPTGKKGQKKHQTNEAKQRNTPTPPPKNILYKK